MSIRSVNFQVEKLPEMMALLKRGLETEQDKALVKSLRMQIVGLEEEHAPGRKRLAKEE